MKERPLKVRESLEFILYASNAMDYLKDQVRSLPKAYTLSGTSDEGLVGLSKLGITALKEERYDDAAAIEKEMEFKWAQLLDLNLTVGRKEQFLATAGQEIVEYFGVKAGLKVLFDNAETFVLPLPKHLDTSIQTYLPGLGDVPGELYKILRHRMIVNKYTREEKYHLWNRLHAICLDIYKVLVSYADVPPAVLHAGHHFKYSYRFGIVPRVRDMVERCEDQVLRWKERLED